jgi:RimJ/RimL family protein N-acetyltransferase
MSKLIPMTRFEFDLCIEEGFRGSGYGKRIMLLIEEKAREFGIQKIGLDVFSYNDVVRRLYEGIGYEVSSLNMIKRLE